MKRLIGCVVYTAALIVVFQTAYIAATWTMSGERAAINATESIVETHRHLAFDVFLGIPAKNTSQ